MKIFIFIASVLLPVAFCGAQTIVTVAGSGTGGDGTPASSASVHDPNDVAILDEEGNKTVKKLVKE